MDLCRGMAIQDESIGGQLYFGTVNHPVNKFCRTLPLTTTSLCTQLTQSELEQWLARSHAGPVVVKLEIEFSGCFTTSHETEILDNDGTCVCSHRPIKYKCVLTLLKIIHIHFYCFRDIIVVNCINCKKILKKNSN